jgi:hypothetical protein
MTHDVVLSAFGSILKSTWQGIQELLSDFEELFAVYSLPGVQHMATSV